MAPRGGGGGGGMIARGFGGASGHVATDERLERYSGAKKAPWSTYWSLLRPYFWPEGRLHRAYAIACFVFLALSKLCALAAPTVNSYKRLTVGESLSGTTWAPAYIAQGPNNRSALVRTLHSRFEWRLPDASANPYLASAALIAAGLDGIERQLDLPAAVDDDLFALSLAEVRDRGIALLPQHLGDALDALAADSVLCGALGETLAAQFIGLKRDEHTQHARHVSDWELARYAAMF